MAKILTLKLQYDDLTSGAVRFRAALTQQLEHILAENQISLGVPLESRVKAWSSIVEKIERKARRLTSISDLDDLVGIRLILLFQRDVEIIHRLIVEKFDVVSTEDTASRLPETQFGYQSRHYVVRIPEIWTKVPSFTGLQSYKAEIQLRTLSQHIWAAASHKLQYKREESVPAPLRRSIYRVSALLETVDLEFNRVLEDRDAYIARQVAIPLPEEPLNVDSAQALITQLLPAENLGHEEDYADLLADLSQFGINTGQKLRNLLVKHLDEILKKDADRALTHDSDGGADEDEYERLRVRFERGVFYTHVGLVRQALSEEFGEDQVRLWLNLRQG